MAGLSEEARKKSGDWRGGQVEHGGAQTRLSSMIDGRCLKTKKKKAVDGGVAAAHMKKRRGRLNKTIHH